MDDMIAAERLAAFIDGRLDEAERAEVMAVLARSQGAREVLADAVAALHPDTAGDTAAGTVRSANRPHRRRSWSFAAAAIAATVALVALGTLRNGGPPSAALLEAVERAPATVLDGGWTDRGWTVMRGSGDLEEIAVFRIGVRLIDLQVAARAGDAADQNRIAADLASLLATLGGGAALTRTFGSIASGAPHSESAIGEEIEATRSILDGPSLRLGYALETARLAARLGQDDMARRAVRDLAGDLDRAAVLLRAASLPDQLDALAGLTAEPLASGLGSLIRTLGR
jgi:hypothetical protein